MEAMDSYIESCRKERDRLLFQRMVARYRTVRAHGIDAEIKLESLMHVNGTIAALDRIIREFDGRPGGDHPVSP